MVLLSGFLEYRPEERDEVRAGLAEVGRRSREDPGCVEYWWAEDLDVPGRFRFFECWETEELLEAHLAMPHEKEFMARFMPLVVGADAHALDAENWRSAMG